MAGKKIGGILYLHKSAVSCMGEKDRARYEEALPAAEGFAWDIVSIDNKQVGFTACPDWDKVFEPNVGDRVVYDLGTKELVKRAASTKNPQIYHRRHLFVRDDYTGFSIDADKSRVKTWEQHDPDRTRMGRRAWWNTFCKEKGLGL